MSFTCFNIDMFDVHETRFTLPAYNMSKEHCTKWYYKQFFKILQSIHKKELIKCYKARDGNLSQTSQRCQENVLILLALCMQSQLMLLYWNLQLLLLILCPTHIYKARDLTQATHQKDKLLEPRTRLERLKALSWNAITLEFLITI